MGIIEMLKQPWPWYVAGPLIGLMVPLLLLIGNRSFGISSNFRHVCAMLPSKNPFFNYNWRREGGWNLLFALGIVLGGMIAVNFLAGSEALELAPATQAQLAELNVESEGAYVPLSIFSWQNLFSLQGIIMMVLGGFLIGFGTRYAGGCTSGHAISGLANFQLPSLLAVVGFFIGGLLMTHLILPWILAL